MTARRTSKEFIEEMERKNPNVIVLGDYSRANDPVLVQCAVCGHQWRARPSNLLGSKNQAPSGCPACAKNQKSNTGNFIAEMRVLHPTLEITGEYQGNKVPIEVRCKACGKVWSPIPNSLRSGHGCPSCAKVRRGEGRRKSEEEFIEQLSRINPDIQLVGHYVKSTAKVLIRCGICGHIWEAAPGNLLNGSGCPECRNASTSFMQEFIAESFRHLIGKEKVLCRDMSAIGMELDILIPDLHFAIEPGSWSAWHRDKVSTDEEKRLRCESKGIRLITVYDSCPESERPFEKDCYCYPHDLGSQKGCHELKSLVKRLAMDAGLRPALSDTEWEKVERLAYRHSRKVSGDDFVAVLRDKNPSIKVLGPYRGRQAKVLVMDLRCRHEFMGDPSALLGGSGCPKCRYVRSSKKLRLSNEEFLVRIKNLNIPIKPLELCKGESVPVRVRCQNCGYEWSPTPHNLFSGHGCPSCAGCRRYDTESFTELMEAINPEIEIVGEYKNNLTPIACRCRICGANWSSRPKSLKRGAGCPNCSRIKRADRQRLTHEEYVVRLCKKNANLKLLSRYESLDKEVIATCGICGQRLQLSAKELLHRAYKRHLHDD